MWVTKSEMGHPLCKEGLISHRQKEGGVVNVFFIVAALIFSYLLTLDLLAYILFVVVLSLLFDRQKATKSPGTRKKQSGGSLLTSRMRHSSVEPPLSLQPVRLLHGAADP